MSDANTDADGLKPSRHKAMILAALVFSAPAFIYSFTDIFCIPNISNLAWLGIALIMVLGGATAISFLGLAKLNSTTVPMNNAECQHTIFERPISVLVRITKATASRAEQICYWLIPCLWVYFTSGVASYVISQIWPQAASGSLWIIIPAAAVLAFVLSYFPSHSARGVVAIIVTICMIQIATFVIFSIMAVAHHNSHPEGSKVWVLDSNGIPVQYVQDSVLDTTKTIPDPNDPTKQIQDPNALAPNKVDSDGNSVPVYMAADANGNPIYKSDGITPAIIIPTDANGKLPTTLSAGVVKAVPEPFRVSTDQSVMPNQSNIFHSPDADNLIRPKTPPLSERYGTAIGCVALFSLAVFQFITSLGHGAKYKMSHIGFIGLLLLAVLLCGELGLSQFLWRRVVAQFMLSNEFTSSASTASAAPIGDTMQMVALGPLVHHGPVGGL